MNNYTTTLILDDKTIKKLVNIKQSIGCIERAFREYAQKKAQMPAKIYLDLKKYSGDFRAMPAYLGGLDSCMLKWVNVHAGNKRIGLPTVMAIIILSDPKTGFPLAIMDGTYATSLRTAAAGAVAAKYCAHKDSRIVGLVGCGAQAKAQLTALRTLFKINEVRVWGHKPSIVKEFLSQMKMKKEMMISAKNIQECVRDCDIVVTTTPSRRPIVKFNWLKPGVHINAIGADAPGKQELDPGILKSARIIIDHWEQASHSGEINVPLKRKLITKKDIYADIGEIVTGKKKGRVRKGEITVFDSTGLAIQDVAIATLIYRMAIRNKKGWPIPIISKD
jgi:alanine dehydrogenase